MRSKQLYVAESLSEISARMDVCKTRFVDAGENIKLNVKRLEF